MVGDLSLAPSRPWRWQPSITDHDVPPQCRRHQCALVCPTSCFRNRTDGRVDLDTVRCVACRACVLICAEFTNISWMPVPASAGG